MDSTSSSNFKTYQKSPIDKLDQSIKKLKPTYSVVDLVYAIFLYTIKKSQNRKRLRGRSTINISTILITNVHVITNTKKEVIHGYVRHP